MNTEIVAMADESALLRREVGTDDELLELLAPTTPDRVIALDDKRSIFLAEWYLGNEDLERIAREEIDILELTQDIVRLPVAEISNDADEYLRFIFCLVLTPEVVSEAIN